MVDAERPEILDRVAEVVAGISGEIRGRASATSGVRAADYRRGQMIGRNAWALIDSIQLSFDAPDVALVELRIRARQLGYQVTPLERTGAKTILSEAADVISASADLNQEVIADGADGRYDQAERERIESNADRVIAEATELKAAARATEVLEGIRAAIRPRIEAHRKAQAS
jgi:hypothetical protein